jgi:mannose-1-phosphate guanylyltransferase / mannose-6-phosphate isomerase
MSGKITPLILSGGFGTRLWPLSRQQMPKQFLSNLFDGEALFTKALNLTSNTDIFAPSIAITHQDHKFLAAAEYQKSGLKPQAIILEPQAKNTAMAIIIACLKAQQITKNDEAKLLILPSDHLISPQDLFEKSVVNAAEIVGKNIVTFGIKPSFASTGFGYIKRAEKVSDNCFAIEKFVEKPNQENADKFIENGNYFWNAGIFLMQANILLQEAQKYLPKQLDIAKEALKNSVQEDCFCQIPTQDYEKAEDISIDYGILEKSQNIATTTMRAGWSDVGDFSSLHDANNKDKNGNVTKGNVELFDTKNSLIKAQSSLVTCLGLENIIAVETDDAILIADKNRSQDIKKITKDFLAQNKDEVKFHNRVFRPWGFYETLSQGSGFKVKRILVNPSASLSLQSHNFRSEHWVVIKGVATVEKEGKIFDLPTGESTFIPTKHKHRLSNKTNHSVEIVEVQMGEKVEESDIERFEDNYGRK